MCTLFSICTWEWNGWAVCCLHFPLELDLAKLLSTLVAPVFTPTSSVWVPHFPTSLPTLELSDSLWPIGWAQSGIFVFICAFWFQVLLSLFLYVCWPLAICLFVFLSTVLLNYFSCCSLSILYTFWILIFSWLCMHCRYFLLVCGLFLSVICSIFCLASFYSILKYPCLSIIFMSPAF